MFGDEVAWRSVVVFAFFPGAYVFLLGYSEALIPLAILVLYALRRRWYLVAGVATGVATGTRLTAVALVAACLVGAVREVAAQHAAIVRTRATVFRLVTAIAAPIIGLAGLVAYMVFLHQRTGSYLTFITAGARRLAPFPRFSQGAVPCDPSVCQTTRSPFRTRQ